MSGIHAPHHPRDLETLAKCCQSHHKQQGEAPKQLLPADLLEKNLVQQLLLPCTALIGHGLPGRLHFTVRSQPALVFCSVCQHLSQFSHQRASPRPI